MTRCPYRTLMRYKSWATDGLNAAIMQNRTHIDEADQPLLRLLIDHINTVDEIFSAHLEGRDHGHAAPRSTEIPSFEELVRRTEAMARWYVDYAEKLVPDRAAEEIAFQYSNGTPGRMTRGEMLLHIAMHGAYHRGNIGILLQKNGIASLPDRMTDFLETEPAAAA